MALLPSGTRKALELMGARHRGRWLFLIVLAALVGVVETIGAFLIFGLLGLVTNPETGIDLPVVGNLRDRFPELSDSDFLLWSAGFVTAFFLLRAVVILAQSYLQNRVAHNAGVRLSTQLLNGYLRMPYSFHFRRNSAELIRNANTSVLQIVTFAFVPLVLLGSEVLLVMGIFVALLIASPVSTLIMIAVAAPVVFLLLQAVRKGMRSLGATNQEMSRVTLQSLQESLQSVRDIKVLGRAGYFEARFARGRTVLARALYLRGVLTELPRIVTETLLVVLVLVFLIVAIASGGSLSESLATLGLFGYAGLRILPSLSRIVASINNLQFSGAALDDVHEQLKLFETMPPPPPSGPPLLFVKELKVSDLSFAYDEKLVLEDVSFTLASGGSLGIVGSTGSGKSTLLDIVMALLEPTAGSVTVDEVSVHDDPRGWQQTLGIVPQSVVLIDDSLRRNIAFGISDENIDEEILQAAIREARLEDVIAALPEGLDTTVGEAGIRLSGGQRQRIAIARALYRDPQVLIFDEATSALDNVTEAELIEGLRSLRDDRTLIMVAHRLTTVRNCDAILVLEGGKLADMGSYDELVERNPLFQAIGS